MNWAAVGLLGAIAVAQVLRTLVAFSTYLLEVDLGRRQIERDRAAAAKQDLAQKVVDAQSEWMRTWTAYVKELQAEHERMKARLEQVERALASRDAPGSRVQ